VWRGAGGTHMLPFVVLAVKAAVRRAAALSMSDSAAAGSHGPGGRSMFDQLLLK
jgi:hypothetical protein